ncbi:MAG: 4Fe-4S ferredoxin [Bacteriovoracaceae bacterium]|nr:4Fe-4S ferredoxin [Bacteriovoracaceae bacterium]
MKRKIIKIDEYLCNGCGDCIVGCSEGALKIVNGKAKLVKEDFCDGFGDCVGECPTGALTVEEREAPAFDLQATKEHLRNTQGEEAVTKMMDAQKKHSGEHDSKDHDCGCPGKKMHDFSGKKEAKSTSSSESSANPQVIPSELTQWPVQLHLVSPSAPFFKNRELVVLSTCSPIAAPDVHWRYVRGRSVVVACPKLDRTDNYIEKLAQIFSESTIPKVIVAIMEVPCCKGLSMMVNEAARLSGRDDLVIEEHTIGLQGNLLNIV